MYNCHIRVNGTCVCARYRSRLWPGWVIGALGWKSGDLGFIWSPPIRRKAGSALGIFYDSSSNMLVKELTVLSHESHIWVSFTCLAAYVSRWRVVNWDSSIFLAEVLPCNQQEVNLNEAVYKLKFYFKDRLDLLFQVIDVECFSGMLALCFEWSMEIGISPAECRPWYRNPNLSKFVTKIYRQKKTTLIPLALGFVLKFSSLGIYMLYFF